MGKKTVIRRKIVGVVIVNGVLVAKVSLVESLN